MDTQTIIEAVQRAGWITGSCLVVWCLLMSISAAFLRVSSSEVVVHILMRAVPFAALVLLSLTSWHFVGLEIGVILLGLVCPLVECALGMWFYSQQYRCPASRPSGWLTLLYVFCIAVITSAASWQVALVVSFTQGSDTAWAETLLLAPVLLGLGLWLGRGAYWYFGQHFGPAWLRWLKSHESTEHKIEANRAAAAEQTRTVAEQTRTAQLRLEEQERRESLRNKREEQARLDREAAKKLREGNIARGMQIVASRILRENRILTPSQEAVQQLQLWLRDLSGFIADEVADVMSSFCRELYQAWQDSNYDVRLLLIDWHYLLERIQRGRSAANRTESEDTIIYSRLRSIVDVVLASTPVNGHSPEELHEFVVQRYWHRFGIDEEMVNQGGSQ